MCVCVRACACACVSSEVGSGVLVNVLVLIQQKRVMRTAGEEAGVVKVRQAWSHLVRALDGLGFLYLSRLTLNWFLIVIHRQNARAVQEFISCLVLDAPCCARGD